MNRDTEYRGKNGPVEYSSVNSYSVTGDCVRTELVKNDCEVDRIRRGDIKTETVKNIPEIKNGSNSFSSLHLQGHPDKFEISSDKLPHRKKRYGSVAGSWI